MIINNKLSRQTSIILGITLVFVFTASSMSVSFGSFVGSPNFQLESGVALEDILCKSNYVLIFRNNNSPICVTEKTSDKLLLRDNIQFIKYDQTIDIQLLTPVLLYSSKLNDDSTDGYSAPGVVSPFDYDVTISKIPKLGETATISMIFNLKHDLDVALWTDVTIPVIFGIENGFDFTTVDKFSSSFEINNNFASYTNFEQISTTTSTVFQTEITPIQVGNWTVFVDGGGAYYYEEFYFIVTEDETILGEKPPRPSGNGRQLEGGYTFSTIDPETGGEVIIKTVP